MSNGDRMIMMVTVTLCIVVLSMVAALLAAIFDPTIPNDPILAILAPGFSTIIGGFIGLITGIKIGQNDVEEQNAEQL